MNIKCKQIVLIMGLLLSFSKIYSQKNIVNKYPSLFWEITGNGLKKPSYLFGTMHVSNKMVFNLSDSFYLAIKSIDAVALELNPDIWQGKMVRLEETKENYANYIKPAGEDLLTESSFRLKKYEEELKAALSTEPMVVNSLLYRTYKAKEDFEEDTFLDLYIFQTGKKLGKRSAGVEDFNETEKIVLQAYADMATEKKKKVVDTDGESMGDISKKIQDAYRRGDLDLMDSLDIMTEKSAAFREKFLYLRNEVQANSIDTILKKSNLFVGVGAAHLPGQRGIIELLRKKGYLLRPIKMTDRDTEKKEETDKLKVPVTFTTRVAADSFYSVDMPGPLFKMSEDMQQLDRRQFSDMSNGSYYLVTRVKTHAAFLGQDESIVINKIDSLLYENIPGKIVKKTMITRDGYKGFDITNRTRRGDLQRYNIFIMPFEVLIFKMAGKENYVDGSEANQFFSSVHLKHITTERAEFTPVQGGFSVLMPQQPSININAANSDGIIRREYEAQNKVDGEGYLILQKNIYNFKFLEEDSFDLKLIEASFRSADIFDKQLQRKASFFNGYPCLDVKEKLKDGSFITARYIIKGPQYFVLAAHSKNINATFNSFFNSFKFTPNTYSANKLYIDTFMHFTALTPVKPDLDDDYRNKLEQVSQEIANSKLYANYNTYWPKNRNAIFQNNGTGELVGITVQKYPMYYYVKDSAKFWSGEREDFIENKELKVFNKDSFLLANGVRGFKFILKDPNSSRTIKRLSLLKDNYMYNLVTMADTLTQNNTFIDSFFINFKPLQTLGGRNIFKNNLNSFFEDLFSKDSSINTYAAKSISDIYFGEQGVPKIIAALNKLKPSQKDYFTIKTKLIAELGYIKDSLHPVVVNDLKQIYLQSSDTSMFQNAVIEALARHKTKPAITLLKELVLQDPPIFDKDYEYLGLFANLKDSLKLAASLYPEFLQLVTLSDFKEPVLSLLVTLVDSGYLKAAQYQSYFSKIYFDAKIALKKQQGKEEKKIESDKKSEDNEEDNSNYNIKNFSGNSANHELDEYAILLMPFYDSNSNVKKYFSKLLLSGEETISLNTAVLLIRNNKPVSDSILLSLASKDRSRAILFSKLDKAKRLDKFPSKFNTQLALARSFMVCEKGLNKLDSVVFLARQLITYNHKKGNIYFFKYRVKKEDDWKIGTSGLQPENLNVTGSNNKLSFMTDKKLRADKPQDEQLKEQLKKILFSTHKSARDFFEEDDNSYRFKKLDEGED